MKDIIDYGKYFTKNIIFNIFLGIILIPIIYYGYLYYDNRNKYIVLQQYEYLVDSFNHTSLFDINHIDKYIRINHKNIFGILLSLKLADYYNVHNKSSLSIYWLKFILPYINDYNLCDFIKLKLANLLINKFHYLQALKIILSMLDSNLFLDLKYNLLGDIYYNLKYIDKAYYYWELSYDNTSINALKHLILLKLNKIIIK